MLEAFIIIPILIHHSLELQEISIKSKSIHQGFRIDEKVLARMKKEAEKKDLSLNKLINQILKDWINRDMYFHELGFIPTSKEAIRIWLDKLAEEDLIKDAKEFGTNKAREYIVYFFGDVTTHTLIDFLEILFSRFPAYQHKISNTRHCFSVKHDISRKYSIFFGELLKSLIEPIVNSPVKIGNPTPSFLSLSFEIG